MRRQSKTQCDPNPRGVTRQRLMDAAGEAFAQNGFKQTTVREICRRAKANVAAVNYHFRDKKELYQSVFEEACCVAQQHFEPPITAGGKANARERLRNFIHQYLQRILSPGRPAWQGKLMAREMLEPTDALDRIVEAAIRPNARVLGEIVADITGLPDSDPRQWLTGASIIAQCLFYMHAKPVINRLRPDLKYDDAMLSHVAEHITAFSWAAMTEHRNTAIKTPTTPSRAKHARSGAAR